MSALQELKVFISWSGALSQDVAVALRDWLPDISDRIKPFMSDVDIAAGQRGLATIEKELAGTTFGIIVVTQKNQNAPWLNFEAGALSKVVGEDVQSRVAPLLIDISNPSQITGPMSQFQAKIFSKPRMLELMLSITAVAGADPTSVTRRFDAFWDDLNKVVDRAVMVDELAGDPPKRPTEDMVEELLNLVRAMRAEQPPSQLTALLRQLEGSRPPAEDNTRGFVAQTAAILADRNIPIASIDVASTDDKAELVVQTIGSLDPVVATMMADEVRKRLGINIRFE